MSAASCKSRPSEGPQHRDGDDANLQHNTPNPRDTCELYRKLTECNKRYLKHKSRSKKQDGAVSRENEASCFATSC